MDGRYDCDLQHLEIRNKVLTTDPSKLQPAGCATLKLPVIYYMLFINVKALTALTIFIAPNMEQIIQSLRSILADRISFEEVGRVLPDRSCFLSYAEHLPEKVTTGYSRKIVTLDPIECLVLY